MMCATANRNRGFTLIEVLVVIVIIATLAGMAVLSLGNSGARAWSGEVQRLAALLQLVADRALIDKAHYGVVLEPDGYSVVRFNPTELEWQSLDEAVAKSVAARFVAHQLPDNMRLEVLEQAELPSAEATEFAAESAEDEQPIPQFIALSSGEVLPVELAMFLLDAGDTSRGATISYSSLHGLQLEWQAEW
ncbi:type II secretion system minor pseudopilin GspH [Microbulbifer taiwanensis]|uniref:Type II secretion system protein H n=1 Tax=Microbulbifer taiwanensis TaxID=986746 RepID=A0ABW1YUS6_9GAMM|nr:type II secretion system minor pseudopilin GspH [Microbulbifer taiwanensis]